MDYAESSSSLGGGALVRSLFDRDSPTNLYDLTPVLAGVDFCTGLEYYAAKRQQTFPQFRGCFKRRQGEKVRQRQRCTPSIGGTAWGEKVQIGSITLAKGGGDMLAIERSM